MAEELMKSSAVLASARARGAAELLQPTMKEAHECAACAQRVRSVCAAHQASSCTWRSLARRESSARGIGSHPHETGRRTIPELAPLRDDKSWTQEWEQRSGGVCEEVVIIRCCNRNVERATHLQLVTGSK